MAKKLATIRPSFCPSTQTKACKPTLQFPYRSFAWRIGFEQSSLVKSEMPIWHAEHLPFRSENCRLTMHENSRIFQPFDYRNLQTKKFRCIEPPAVWQHLAYPLLSITMRHWSEEKSTWSTWSSLSPGSHAFLRNSLALDPSYSFLHLIHISFWETGRGDGVHPWSIS
jgi:hypothetical protein